MKARLYERYVNEVVPALKEKRQYTNIHQVPRLEKIVVNMGVSASLEKSAVDDAAQGHGPHHRPQAGRQQIAPQHRQFQAARGPAHRLPRHPAPRAMYEFFDRLVATALPRIRDFRGLSPRSFDGRGNYTLGVGDQTIFPEIELDKIKRHQGMDITIVTTAPTNEEALDLLKLMGMPFAEAKQSRGRNNRSELEADPKHS